MSNIIFILDFCNMKRIYLDNASTTPIDHKAKEAMTDVINNNFGNPSSIHFHGRHSKTIIEEARKTIAKIFKVSIGEIFFTSSATEANNMILKNSVDYLEVKRIISSPTEHHCILHTLDYIEKTKGTEIIYLNVDAEGNIDYSQLQSLLNETKKKTLVSLMYGNNEIGTILDLEKISDMCFMTNTLLHTDAVQMIGKYDIDLSKIKTSFMSGTAHKFHGPKGASFFYMNMDNIIPAYIHGGAQERNMRAGTENIYGIIGMAKALEVAIESKEETIKHISILRSHLKTQLAEKFEDIKFNGNQSDKFLHHILSVSFPASPKADMLMFNLDIAGISASSGSACSSGIESDSHVLQAIKHPSDRKTIRFSFSKYNTIEEIDFVIQKMSSMVIQKAHQ